MAERVPARLTPAEGRRFAWTVGSAFLVFAALAVWRDARTLALVLAAPGVALVVAGLLLPSQLGPVQRSWMRLAHAISHVTTPVVMTLAWLLVNTPVGLLRRAFGGNPLRHESQDDSYWKTRPEGARRSDLTRPF